MEVISHGATSSAGASLPAVKRTCDGCSASKVKCSGTSPCTRCKARGVDCFYRPRKKRAAKPHSVDDDVDGKKVKGVQDEDGALKIDDSPSQLFDLQSKAEVLRPHEKRSWIVFFSLYKNYNAGCARFWFERQLARIKMRLERAHQHRMLDMLKQWCKNMEVDYEKVQDRGQMCMKVLADPNSKGTMIHDCGGIHLHIDGQLSPCSGHSQRIFSLNDPNRIKIDDIFSASPDCAQVKLVFSGKFPEDYATYQVNPAFEKLFGISQQELNRIMDLMGSGLLPWGGDLLALLAHNEADIFAFMQVCGINLNWNFLGRKRTEFPLVRECPSAHVIPFSTPHSPEPIPCLMKCLHRELVDLQTGISIEITMTFEPLRPLNSLSQVSSSSHGSPSSAFERELPLADETDASAGTPAESDFSVDDLFPENEVFFPDIGIAQNDEDFFDGLLSFARIDDDSGV